MNFVYDDGGRRAAGFKGDTGDCVTRAISIATKKPYMEVYGDINRLISGSKQGALRGKYSARSGVPPAITRLYMKNIGWSWVPLMQIGTGCHTHLRSDELPKGNIIARCSRHLVAVIDGVVHDTSDPSREGTRAVYGYWKLLPTKT